ncbi:4Fe-4S dicluster domain-containing protein [Eggerthella sinensis]|uniref:4Fe-4S dicluster domain-containing protein n=1 Tax=Eggerthella sinensis TaxID=242230 RepID=UPI0022DEF03F|nr:4Fe-4S dicluster domain-containing protein [Eggerthella sinensis]
MTTWGMLIDLKRCAGCGACVVACQLQNNQSPGVSWVKLDTVEWGEEAGEAGRAYLPHACMHCDNPECVAVCPTGASQKLDDGVVVVEYDACIACGYCMSACPYGARVLNEGKGNYFGEYAQAPYEPTARSVRAWWRSASSAASAPRRGCPSPACSTARRTRASSGTSTTPKAT